MGGIPSGRLGGGVNPSFVTRVHPIIPDWGYHILPDWAVPPSFLMGHTPSFLTGGVLHPGQVGTPIPGQDRGYLIPGQIGGPHSGQVPGLEVPPSQVRMGAPQGTPYPGQVQGQGGGGIPNWNSTACTCYAAGGMPLAFTQEDFLVSSKIENKNI